MVKNIDPPQLLHVRSGKAPQDWLKLTIIASASHMVKI